MSEFDTLWIWNDKALAASLGWYRAVSVNRRPAKFRIARTIPVALVPAEVSESDLWQELERVLPLFVERRRTHQDRRANLGPARMEPSLLDLAAELVGRMLRHCNFCRWNCEVDRGLGTKPGICKLGDASRVSTHYHNAGAELAYRGTHGSGTIFFTSCNMRCVFCENGDIIADKDRGVETTPITLAAMAWALRHEGCHNINWMGGDPTIHLHTIVEAIALLGNGFAPSKLDYVRALSTRGDRFELYPPARRHGTYARAFNVPMVWQSNFYMTPEAMMILRLVMDAWLPDFKFGPGRCAVRLSRTPQYWPTVTENLRRLKEWGEDFTIRHLIMPGHLDCCTVPVLEWIAREMPDVPVNLLADYRPENFCEPGSRKFDPRHADLARNAPRAEIEAAHRHAKRLGLHFETLTYETQRLAAPI